MEVWKPARSSPIVGEIDASSVVGCLTWKGRLSIKQHLLCSGCVLSTLDRSIHDKPQSLPPCVTEGWGHPGTHVARLLCLEHPGLFLHEPRRLVWISCLMQLLEVIKN